MGRFTLSSLFACSGAGLLAALAATAVVAQSVPGYWAGDVSLAAAEDTPSHDGEVDFDSEPTAADPFADDPREPPLLEHDQLMPTHAPPRAVARRAATPPPVNTPVTNQARQALGFYGGHSAVATLSQMPRRAPIQHAAPPASQAQHAQRRDRTMQSASNGPTVSPYLNLFRDDDSATEAVPNYYAFVRPQLEQQEANQRQQREIQQMQRQLQNSSPRFVGPQHRQAAAPGRSTPARYMDTAQFYSGWRK